MFFQNINLIVVFVAAIAGVIIGAAWFSPYLFGRKWIEGMKLTSDSSKNMYLSYGLTFIFTLISAYVLAVLFNSLVVTGGIWSILLVPFLLWLSFAVPISMNDYLWGNKKLELILISLGYTLVSLSIMSLIVALFS